MYLTEIELNHFRNYDSVKLELSQGITGIFGSNGHGKSNFLEAIHMITQGYSQRTRRIQDLLKWESDEMMIRATGVHGDLIKSNALSLDKKGNKQLRTGGGSYKLFSKLLGSFATLSIGPRDIAIIQEGPAERRKFLDALGCQFSTGYMQDLKNFNQILKQRNALYKSGTAIQDDLWEGLSRTLVQFGGELTLRRIHLIKNIQDEVLKTYQQISSGAEEINLHYHTSFGLDFSSRDLELTLDLNSLKHQIIDSYWTKLVNRRKREQDLKTTLYGPHKDDLVFDLKGKSLREFGSQGQQRSTALSLKLAAAVELEKQFQAPPILLLDDIFSELDKKRRQALSERIIRCQQVFVATPEVGDLPFETQQSLIVNKGSIHA